MAEQQTSPTTINPPAKSPGASASEYRVMESEIVQEASPLLTLPPQQQTSESQSSGPTAMMGETESRNERLPAPPVKASGPVDGRLSSVQGVGADASPVTQTDDPRAQLTHPNRAETEPVSRSQPHGTLNGFPPGPMALDINLDSSKYFVKDHSGRYVASKKPLEESLLQPGTRTCSSLPTDTLTFYHQHPRRHLLSQASAS